MSNDELVAGREITVYRLVCPHCLFEEDMDSTGDLQVQYFDLEQISEDGLRRIWKCLSCGKRFRTRLE